MSGRRKVALLVSCLATAGLALAPAPATALPPRATEAIPVGNWSGQVTSSEGTFAVDLVLKADGSVCVPAPEGGVRGSGNWSHSGRVLSLDTSEQFLDEDGTSIGGLRSVQKGHVRGRTMRTSGQTTFIDAYGNPLYVSEVSSRLTRTSRVPSGC